MNHSYHYNTDHRNIPIVNLDNLQPVYAPRDKLDLPSGSSDQPTKEQPPAEHSDPEKAVIVQDVPPEPTYLQRLMTAIRSRRGFWPWAIGACIALCGSWKVITHFSHFLDPIVGIDPERKAQAYHNIFNATRELGKQHEQCIMAKADTCIADFDFAHDAERSHIDVIRLLNQEKIQEASQKTGQCIMAVYDTQTALRDLVLSGGTLPFVNNEAVCSAADRQALLAIAGGDVRQGQNQVLNLLQIMTKEGETQAEYLKDFAVYNRDYFFGRLALLEADLLLEIGQLAAVSLNGISLMNVTGLDALNGIVACVSPQEGSAALCSFPTVSTSLRGVLDTAEAYIGIGQEQIRLAAMVIATLVDRYDWAVGSIQDFVRIFQGIRSVLGRPFDLALDSFGGIDFGQFYDIAPGAFFVPGDLDFPEFPSLPSIQPILDELETEIVKLKGAVSSVAAQVSDELQDKVDELVTSVRAAFGDILHDYNPPKPPGFATVDVEQISTSFSNRRRELANLVAAEVGKLGFGRGPLPETNVYIPPTAKVDFNATTAQVNDASASLRQFEFPEVSMWIIELFLLFLKYFLLCDSVRIIWGILHRFRKMWDESAVPVPHVEMPVTPVQDDEEEQPSVWWKAFSLITDDGWKKIAPLMVGGFVAALFLGAYVFTYRHYHNNCVVSSSGTYVGKQIATQRNNRITFGTTRAQATQKSRVEAHFDSKCEKARFATTFDQNQQEQHLAALMNEYSVTMAESQRLLNCIDFDALGDFDSGLNTCALPLDTQLDSGVVECNWGSCDLDCDNDALEEEVKTVVVESVCVVEQQGHAEIWKKLAELAIWLCIAWLSRLVQECPPHLFPDTFGSNHVHLSYMRDRKTHEIVGGEGQDPSSAIDKAIASQYFWNKAKAWGEVTCLVLFIAGLIAALVWYVRTGL